MAFPFQIKKAADESHNSVAPDHEPELNELESFLALIIKTLLFVGLVFMFIVSGVRVDGRSMYPTLYDGELVIIRRLGSGIVSRGDIVAVQSDKYPGNGEVRPLIKRVIATEGQSVVIDYNENLVYVDNLPYPERYINYDEDDAMTPVEGWGTEQFVVPDGCVFVMGDNRNHSTDSRSEAMGPVRYSEILGVSLIRYMPEK